MSECKSHITMPVKSIESLSDGLLGESINQTGVLFNGAALRGGVADRVTCQ